MRGRKHKAIVPDVADQIRAKIVQGQLIPGSKIAQDELATDLGVSRLPIRQALLILQREGLVLLDHGRSAIVAPFDVKFIADLFDCRAAVEEYVAGLLASRRDFDASGLKDVVSKGFEAANRGEIRPDLVISFHAALYEAVGNEVLVQLLEPLLHHVLRVLTFAQARTGRPHSDRQSQLNTWTEHAEIVDAIVRRKIGRARALARAHIEHNKHTAISFLVSSMSALGRPKGRHG